MIQMSGLTKRLIRAADRRLPPFANSHGELQRFEARQRVNFNAGAVMPSELN